MLRDLFGCIKLQIRGKSEQRKTKLRKLTNLTTLLCWEGSFSHFSPFPYYHEK